MEKVSSSLRVVLAVGDESYAQRVKDALTLRGHGVAVAEQLPELLEYLSSAGCDVAVVDHQIAGQQTTELFERLRSLYPALPLVILTSQGAEAVIEGADQRWQSQYVVAREGSIETLGWAVELAAERSRTQYLRQELERERRQQPRLDALTGLANRVAFNHILDREMAVSRRYEVPLSVAVIEVNELAYIKEQGGQEDADTTLAEVARIISGAVRNCDVVARYRPEQLAILFTHTSGQGARIAAQRLREMVNSSVFAGAIQRPVSLAIGVASTEEDWGEDLLDRAEQAKHEDQISQVRASVLVGANSGDAE